MTITMREDESAPKPGPGTKINWDEPYSQDELPSRGGWWIAGIVGAAFWMMICLLIALMVSCGPSTAEISTMTGVELWEAHRKSPRYRLDGTSDMEIVRALCARGGLTQADVDWYAAGHKGDNHPTIFTCWGGYICFYDWEALGYASNAEVDAAMRGIGGRLPGTTIYTSGGAFRITRHGGGSITVRGSR